MEPETEYVIDVESEQIDCTNLESIDRWYSTSQIQRILSLNKAALQKAIAKLTSLYSLDIKILRRGGARATEYSQVAVDAIKLLNSYKFAELRKLVDKTPIVPTAGTLAISEYTPALDQRISQLGQNAASNSASLNQSVMQVLAQIASENQSAQQRDNDLNTARINAAQNRGAANALAIFQAEQKAQNEVLAQLRASQLGGIE